MAIAIILGIGAFALSSGPARADDGATWVVETLDDIDVVSTSLKLDSQDNPHISYSDGGIDSLYYIQWTGTHWTKETVDAGMAWTNSLALDTGDQPHIGYSRFFYSLMYAYKTDGIFTTEPVFPGLPQELVVWDCSLALDSDNVPHMSASLILPGYSDFVLIYGHRTGVGWDIDPVAETFAWSSSIAIDRSDEPCIAYSDFFDELLMYADSTGIQPVAPGLVVSTSLALDSNDRPNIAYATAEDTGSLHFARWTGTDWVVETVDPSPDIWDCSLVLDSQDRPHICYVEWSELPGDVVMSTVKYAHWTGSAWDIQIVDQETSMPGTAAMKTLNQRADVLKEKITLPLILYFGGKFCSIDVDSQDLPHISYGSLLLPAAFSLHYAHLVLPTVPTQTPPEPKSVSPQTPLPRLLNPANISVQFLSINPKQATANQPVTISTNVVNSGDEGGNYNIALKVNGSVVESRMVSVGPQATQPVKFTLTESQPGTYSIAILDKAGSFSVLGAGGNSSRAGAFIALALIGVLLVATVVVLLLRRT